MPTIYNKVSANGKILIDLSQDTVTQTRHIMSGYIGHLANGYQVIGTGGADSDVHIEKPVKFYDYDGTILHEYTIAEAKDLTELPPNPTHTGLTAEGWNWTLAELKEYATNYPDADINIGQTYITSDGATKLHVTIDNDTLHPSLALAVNGTITIDWGDNTTPDTMTGTNTAIAVYQDHDYLVAGNYVISISVNSGEFAFYYSGVSDRAAIFFNQNHSIYSNSYSSILRKVFLGNNARIGTYAFQYQLQLETVCIPKNTNINFTQIFYRCRNLKHLTVSGSNLTIGSYFLHDVSSLKSISIPKQIGLSNYFLGSNYSLTSLTLPDNVTSLPSISGQGSITKLVIPNSVTTIGGISSFYSLEKLIYGNNSLNLTGSIQACYRLKSIDFALIQTASASSVFNNDYCLTSVTYTPYNSTFSSSTFSNCQLLTHVSIPNQITTIENSVFSSCWSLRSVVLPNTVTSINTAAFSNCKSLESVILSNTLITLNTSAFSYCTSLITLTIPSTVTTVGNSCFSNCYSMQEYHFLPTSPPTLGAGVFNQISSNCKIYVPYSADHSILNNYKTATNWSTWASYIQEEPQS